MAARVYPVSRSYSARDAFSADLRKAVATVLKRSLRFDAKAAGRLAARDVVDTGKEVIVVGEAYEMIAMSEDGLRDLFEALPAKYPLQIDTAVNFIYFMA